ncbi:alpha/beta hydrolase [Microvirga lenta]|uniref:alpha/beta hydrolase n=1 Tax=Microvirga lenta TaxID=2881337 RepID=UPI001CFF6B10|nr:alpha/beta hydrolase [Microvirga lenta]MCB5175736.1 alpha/beta hydrolase [Microvirga lenta]
MWILYLVATVVIVYAGLLALLAVNQTNLLFPARMAAANRPALPNAAKRLELATSDGERLIGVRLSPPGSASGTEPLLLGFGGNAWNAEAMALYLSGLFPRSEVVAFHYRGYPPSSGQPSAQALLADSTAIFDHLQQNRKRPVIAVGFSIGTGVAAHLARHRPLEGLVLVTPFDSLQALAKAHFPWAPVSLFLRHRMSPVEDLQGVSTSTAMIVAGRDTIVPARRSEPLRKAIPNLVLDRTIAEAGHNDLYGNPAFAEAMHEAVARLEAAAR